MLRSQEKKAPVTAEAEGAKAEVVDNTTPHLERPLKVRPPQMQKPRIEPWQMLEVR